MRRQERQHILDPSTLAKLSNFSLIARLIVDGFFLGLHRGPKQAFSLEYSKHREYYPGDPLKRVDWKLFGKTEELYVKQYEEETNAEVWLMMDVSRSMRYAGQQSSVSKWLYSCHLAAALAWLMIEQRDRVGLMLFDQTLRKLVPPASSRYHFHHLAAQMNEAPAGGETDFEQVARQIGARMTRRGVVVLFSDFLGPWEGVEKILKWLMSNGNEMLVFHVLAPEEKTFPFDRLSWFEDMENGKRLMVNPESMRKAYLEQMQERLRRMREWTRKLKLHYCQVDTGQSYEKALMEFLRLRERTAAR